MLETATRRTDASRDGSSWAGCSSSQLISHKKQFFWNGAAELRRGKRPIKPSSSHCPIPLDSFRRDLEHIGYFLNREAGEVSQFHDANLAGFQLFQFRQGSVELLNLRTGLRRYRNHLR